MNSLILALGVALLCTAAFAVCDRDDIEHHCRSYQNHYQHASDAHNLDPSIGNAAVCGHLQNWVDCLESRGISCADDVKAEVRAQMQVYATAHGCDIHFAE